MKTTRTQISTLNDVAWGRYDAHYWVNSRTEVTKEVRHKIPYEPGWFTNKFPKYLAGFEDCYEMRYHTDWGKGSRPYWHLKPEYEDNRPLYTIKITYTELDITLTDEGREEVQRRYEIHKRNLEKYARLLG